MPRAKKSAAAAKPLVAPATSECGAPGAGLLAVDLQSSLLGMLPIATARAVRARAGLALAAATAFRLPILFTEQVPTKLGPTEPSLRKLAPDAAVFSKNTFSAIADDAVLAVLRAQQIEHLLLIGLETPVCLYQTALGALAEGFQVTVLSDAVAARRGDDHAACLAALRHSGVHVLPVETVFYALLHDASHPLFRAFTALVKTHAN